MAASNLNTTHIETQRAGVWERLTGELTERHHTTESQGEMHSPRIIQQGDIMEDFRAAGLSEEEAKEETAVFAAHAFVLLSDDL